MELTKQKKTAKRGVKTNELTIKLPAISENEAVARAIVGAFAARLDPTLEELADIRCAVSEAVTNCVVHAYKEREGSLYITMRSYDDKTLKITVKDTGKGIENVKRAMEPMFTTESGTERSGMGFAVMQSFTDDVRVRSALGKGTTVTLTKRMGCTEE